MTQTPDTTPSPAAPLGEGRTAFTLGPWAVNPFKARVDCSAVSVKGGLLPVAEMLWPTAERSEAETLANAHLIAAAPMLYDANVDALAALRLLSIGMADDAKAIEMIDAHIDEIETALVAARGEA